MLRTPLLVRGTAGLRGLVCRRCFISPGPPQVDLTLPFPSLPPFQTRDFLHPKALVCADDFKDDFLRIPLPEGYQLQLEQLEKRIGLLWPEQSGLLRVFMGPHYVSKFFPNHHTTKVRTLTNVVIRLRGQRILSVLALQYISNSVQGVTAGDLLLYEKVLLRGKSLMLAAYSMGLDSMLLEKHHKTEKHRKIALRGCVEALVGSVYEYFGLEKAAEFVGKFIFHDILEVVTKQPLHAFLSDVLIAKMMIGSMLKQKARFKVLSKNMTRNGLCVQVHLLAGDLILAQGQGQTQRGAIFKAAQGGNRILSEALKRYGSKWKDMEAPEALETMRIMKTTETLEAMEIAGTLKVEELNVADKANTEVEETNMDMEGLDIEEDEEDNDWEDVVGDDDVE